MCWDWLKTLSLCYSPAQNSFLSAFHHVFLSFFTSFLGTNSPLQPGWLSISWSDLAFSSLPPFSPSAGCEGQGPYLWKHSIPEGTLPLRYCISHSAVILICGIYSFIFLYYLVPCLFCKLLAGTKSVSCSFVSSAVLFHTEPLTTYSYSALKCVWFS